MNWAAAPAAASMAATPSPARSPKSPKSGPFSPKSSLASPPSSAYGAPRVRQTQKFAAERLVEALRRTTAIVPEASHGGDKGGKALSVDEVLGLGASAVFGLSEEVQQLGREISRLQLELSGAYRASALAAADDKEDARRAIEAYRVEAENALRKAAARERELETAVVAAHEQLAEAHVERRAVQSGLDRAMAGGKLLEQHVVVVRDAARGVVAALPPSAAEEAAESERLALVASGELVPEADTSDAPTLLKAALERASRCTEQTRASVAEAALLRTELEAERASLRTLRQEHEDLLSTHHNELAEKVNLARKLAEALEARESAEEAARRFQSLLLAQRGDSGGAITSPARAAVLSSRGGSRGVSRGASPPTVPSERSLVMTGPGSPALPSGNASPAMQPRVSLLAPMMAPWSSQAFAQLSTPLMTPLTQATPLSPTSAAAEAAVDGLEAAVREATALTAMLAKPTGL